MLIPTDYDNAIRSRDGERLDQLFEEACDRLFQSGKPNHPAVIAGNRVISFRELDERANQVARFLRGQGIRSGERVGLLFDRSFQTYIALLAVLKINAAYVPLDADFPQARIDFIAKDAEIRAFLTLSSFEPTLRHSQVPAIFLDREQEAIDVESCVRLSDPEKGSPADSLCYIVYTSGSTGNPKGVAVEHPSICNFVKVAAEVYGYTETDRVYQGMTIAFDFSVEELWVPLIAGATIVPAMSETHRVGQDLWEFLLQERITALCCVPTLLATIEEDLPLLRLLLVSGEACPQDLVARWYRDGRTILNVYGPTEATVSCTWTVLHPDKAVTIGQPLPSYCIVILDPEKDEELPDGALGEIGVAGIGLARGYVNRDDLTQRSFIPDFVGLPNNPSRRIYRTGDLGRITAEGEVEYQGRIDFQVKIRGYRIELTEIESALLSLPQIAQAVVSTHAKLGESRELVAFYTLKNDAPDVPREKIFETLRQRLPPYMVPTYIEKLASIPMLSCNKVDRKSLPPPTSISASRSDKKYVAPKNDSQRTIAAVLEGIMGVGRVSVEDNFFDDLGLHSLMIARFGAALRARLKRLGSRSVVSIRDIYLNPTVACLAAHLDSKAEDRRSSTRADAYRIPSNFEYYTCGALQLFYYFSSFFLVVWALTLAVPWVFSAGDGLNLFFRISAVLAVSLLGWATLSIAAKWLLVGKWKSERIPIWSLDYFRFWLVKQIIETNPMALFRGYPLYNVYLRLLGAKIGKNVVIESRTTPVCTDLISIGDGTILRKDSMLLSHKARSNYIRTGGITIGKDVVVGEGSVIEADTVMEDRSQLGHASSLHVGQVIPEGKRYHGSPASPTTTDYRFHENRHVGTVRRVIFTLVQLLGCLSVTAALLCGLYYAVAFIGLPKSKPFSLDWAADTLVISLSLFFALFALRLLLVASGARLLRLFLKENKTYTLYGFHFLVFRMISSLSNSRVFNLLFGDSSYIVGYLKLVGYRFSQIVQTGTNFGLAQKHDNPFLIRIGSGTIISDGLYFGNARMSNTAFRPAKTSVGTGNFVGNNVFYPPDGKLGDNCFVATKTMVPIEGKTRSNTGLLGSPCFEIPRPDFMDQAKPGDADRRKSLRKKNAHNLIALLTLVFFGFTYFHLSVLLIYGAAQTYSIFGIWAWAVAANAILFLAIAYCVVLERGSLGFRSLVPTVVSVYDKEYWRVERLWKYSETMLRWLWLGTPFRSILSRMLGMKLGKKVFDDGLYVSEKSLVQIGDHCNLNESAVLQPHALEQLVYKSDYIKIGACCTIEANAFVHYGCTIGDHVVVGLDSFVMKGESIEANSSWRGNPAVRDVGMSYPATLPFWIASPQPRRDFAATRRGYPPFDRRPILVSARSRSDRKKTPRHGTLHAAHPSYPNAEAEMPHPGERPVRRLLTRCAALVLVALFALFQSSSELGESPLPPTAQTGPIAQSQSGTAVRTVSELHPSTAANLRPQAGSPQRISELLKQAQYHYAMKRWTRPRGNNALESYRKVLYLDPGNPTARQGINRLRDAYLARADTALARGEQAKAFFNYQRALVIDPSVSRKRIKISQTIGGPTR